MDKSLRALILFVVGLPLAAQFPVLPGVLNAGGTSTGAAAPMPVGYHATPSGTGTGAFTTATWNGTANDYLICSSVSATTTPVTAMTDPNSNALTPGPSVAAAYSYTGKIWWEKIPTSWTAGGVTGVSAAGTILGIQCEEFTPGSLTGTVDIGSGGNPSVNTGANPTPANTGPVGTSHAVEIIVVMGMVSTSRTWSIVGSGLGSTYTLAGNDGEGASGMMFLITTTTQNPDTSGPYTDLVVNSSTNTEVTSASYSFTNATPPTGNVRQTVVVTGGTGWTPGPYQIASVPIAGTANLASSPAAVSTTGGDWYLAAGVNFAYSGGTSSWATLAFSLY
jgi:hypothetical protein